MQKILVTGAIMPISIQQISYIHPDKEVLFSDLNFAISKGQKLGCLLYTSRCV